MPLRVIHSHPNTHMHTRVGTHACGKSVDYIKYTDLDLYAKYFKKEKQLIFSKKKRERRKEARLIWEPFLTG